MRFFKIKVHLLVSELFIHFTALYPWQYKHSSSILFQVSLLSYFLLLLDTFENLIFPFLPKSLIRTFIFFPLLLTFPIFSTPSDFQYLRLPLILDHFFIFFGFWVPGATNYLTVKRFCILQVLVTYPKPLLLKTHLQGGN